MGTRAGRWAQHVAEDIDLPTIDAPQYVNEDGYEVDADTFLQALAHAEAVDSTSEAEGEGDVEEQAEEVEYEGEGAAEVEAAEVSGAEQEEEVAEEEVLDEEGEAEPLLSLSDSNVLHYSLMATRQHHLKHLLPHVFSHPVVPTNNRPRARPPAKGTFLWPTPPPLVHPLPHREYHAPSHNAVAGPSGSPAPGQVPDPNGASNPAGNAEPKRKKYQRKKDKMQAMEAPAHEIECIARVTLSIGPISYPGTELWVGRFVLPRAEAPKLPRTKRDKVEKPEKTERKRAKAGEGKAPGPKKVKAQTGPPGPRPTQYRPRQPAVAGPSNYAPPRPPPGHPHPGQGPPRPPAPPRAELSPDLIRRVNEAATRHPWLSQIIHKAARTQATKEELAKLGRVVNRLKEGKDVGEGADDPAPPVPGAASAPGTTASRPPAPSLAAGPTAGPSALPTPAPVANVSAAASDASEPLTPPPHEDGSDSDSDVDMTGPRQVGGGPGETDPAETTADGQAPSVVQITTSAGGSILPSQDPPSATAAAGLPSASIAPPLSAPSVAHLSPSPAASFSSPAAPYTYRPTIPDSSSFAAPSYARPPGPHPGSLYPNTYRPPMPAWTPGAAPYPQNNAFQTPPPPPPPPRPTYPLPPPFLVVAFKEAPTEKYLLPLGSLSYVTRQGDKGETISVKEATPPQPIAVPEATPDQPSQVGPPPSVTSRTRASLGRNAKEPTPPPVVERSPEPVPIEAKPELPKSGLPPLDGTAPADGVVLISTFLPADEWQKPDWNALSSFLPFNNPRFDRNPAKATEVKVEPEPEQTDPKASPSSPRSVKRSRQVAVTEAPVAPDDLPFRGKLLNLAAESFMPEEGDLHAVTIRLSEVTDQVWQRIKTISGMIATAEMKALGEHRPDLMPNPVPAAGAIPAPISVTPPVSSPTPSMPPPPSTRMPFVPGPELREAYLSRKRNLFRHLLQRVPTRKFLRFRLSSPRPDIVDATNDKWGPRPYPISTKALYTRDEEYADEGVPLSPEPFVNKKGSRKAPEPEVTFEMPVSLDQLDEMVAENAMKGGKAKGVDGRKRHGKRWVPGTICEGCGEANKRVWRAGPGGKGTLCNACGDKWTSGTLHTLAAPGAASQDKDNEQETAGVASSTQADTATQSAQPDDGGGMDVDKTPEAAADDDASMPNPSASHDPAANGPQVQRDEVMLTGNAESTTQQAPATEDNVPPTDAAEEAKPMNVDPPRDLQIDGKGVDAPHVEPNSVVDHVDASSITNGAVVPEIAQQDATDTK